MGPPELQNPAPVRQQNLAVRVLRRDGLIVGFCIAALVLMAWWWLFRSAGIGGSTSSGGTGMAGMGGGVAVWTWTYLFSAFAMWAFMMVAMMLPSAAPMILLFARLSGQSAHGTAQTISFAATYLIVWGLFSALAAASQAALVSMAAASAEQLQLVDGQFSGILLLLVGAYQLSPLKTACLDHCRSPLAFLMRGWRPGWRGATRLGMQHGLYCLGCCWALMLLLFVAGVMNLAWIAALTIVVLAEKLAPPMMRVRQIVAVLLLLGGILLIAGR